MKDANSKTSNEVNNPHPGVHNCLDLIRSKYSDLNKREKVAARYILENPRKVIHMTISDITSETSVSETTIFRMATHLGYKGFYDMKIALVSSTVDPLENLHSEIKPDDDHFIICQKLMTGYKASMQKTADINKEADFNLLIEKMNKAEHVFYFANGGSYPLALDAHHKFVRNGIKGIPTSDPHWMSMYIALAKPNDLLILFSSSGRNKDLLTILESAHERGLFVALITAEAKSPLAEKADLILISAGSEYNVRYEALESRITTLFIIDTLYLRLATQNESMRKLSLDNIQNIREVIADHREESIPLDENELDEDDEPFED